MLKLERIYTKPYDMNGYRLFVDRMWCRGISKRNAKIDHWAKAIAPSITLRKWFKHEDTKFLKFKSKYVHELNQNHATKSLIQLVQTRLQKGNVIILYGAKNTIHNNAVVLRSYLNQKLNLHLKPNHSVIHFLYNDGETNRNQKLITDAKWLNQHKTTAKKLRLRANGVGEIYHDTSHKALDHQSLMSIVLKH